MNLKALFKSRHYHCDCVDPDGWFNQPSWATYRKVFVAALFLPVGIWALHGSATASWMIPDARTVAGIFGSLTTLTGIISLFGLVPELLGTWHFAFKVKGEWHIHEQDPRKKLGSTTWKWTEVGTEVDPSSIVWVIEGPIFRFRHGGRLFKVLYRLFRRQDPNQIFWPVHGVTGHIVAPMRLADKSSIYNVRLLGEDRDKPHQVCVSLDRAYDIAARFLRLGEYLGRIDQESGWFNRLWLNHDAIWLYLNSTRDRRSSPVGKHARELLEAAIADLGIVTGSPQQHPRRREALERLERLVAERMAQETETVPAG